MIFISKAYAVDYATEAQNSAHFLDIINAQRAYDLGYTGSGVSIGVFDTSVRTDHPEFTNSITTMPPFLTSGEAFLPNWNESVHGTHVAGIIAANRDGVGIHGIAFDAHLYTMTFLDTKNGTSQPIYIDFEEYFRLYPSVDIVNNSWGTSYFPYLPEDLNSLSPNSSTQGKLSLKAFDYDSLDDFYYEMEYNTPIPYELGLYAIDNPSKLFVFSTGNDGLPTSAYEKLLPRYLGTELSNWIIVGSLDSSQIHRAANGELSLDTGAFSLFSNQANGSELWTLFAPGTLINSAYATDNSYVLSSGTSMAAPLVTGALALVQQKYPWLTGKQLADSVLTTANSSFTPPEYIIQLVPASVLGDFYLLVTYVDRQIPYNTLTYEEIEDNVRAMYAANPEAFDSIGAGLEPMVNLVYSGNLIIDSATKEEVFGQGILDVGKAINGIAELDANRMTSQNAMYIDELKTSYALENFDTQGYVAEFSNDISQVQWNDNYHYKDYQSTGSHNSTALALQNKDLGLIKTGAGQLILSGINTYSGATVVENGILTIAKREDGSGGILTSSDIVVRSQGTLSGNGIITENLINKGIVEPGYFGQSNIITNKNNTLTVATYTQDPSATLRIKFDKAGNNGKLVTYKSSSTIDGTLLFSPITDYYAQDFSQVYSIYAGITPQGSFDEIGVEKISPSLTFTATSLNPEKYQIDMQRKNDAYSRYAQSATALNIGNALSSVANLAQDDMQVLITALDFSSSDGTQISQALEDLSATQYDILIQNSFSHQQLLNSYLTQVMLLNDENKHFSNKNQNVTLLSSLDDRIPASATQKSINVWGQVLGSKTHQSSSSRFTGYSAESSAFVTGFDYNWPSGLTNGVHISMAQGNSSTSNHSAKDEHENYSFGVQGYYSPRHWDNTYVLGQARVNVTQHEMQRLVQINNYMRINSATYKDFVAGTMLGIGKDYTFSSAILSPLFWLEYSHLYRPSFQEHGGGASSISLGATNHFSLKSALGLHLLFTNHITNTINIDFDFLLAWQHEFIESAYTTESSFIGYSPTFTSKTDVFASDFLNLQASMRLNHKNSFYTQLDLGAQWTEAKRENFYFGLKMGIGF